MNRCREYGDPDVPGCLEVADDRYTMRFDEIGQPPLYWCAHCGPLASALNKALEEALETRGPEFAAELEEAIEMHEKRQREAAH